MKKLTSTLALASLIVLAACNKDEKTSTPTTIPKTGIDLLTDGSWDLETMRNVIKLNGYVMGDNTENMTGKVTFYKNNTVVAVIPGEENDTTAYAYNGTANTITMDDMTFDIITLNANKFVFESEETESDSSGTSTISFITTISLKK
jgi:hypothetical protein